MMTRKGRHNKPTLIPNITAAAVAAARERMRNDKDMGIYIKKRIWYPRDILREIFVMTMTMYCRKETIFREFIDAIHTACVRTDMYRLCPDFTENAAKTRRRYESFDMESLAEECEYKALHGTDDEATYEKARKTTNALFRIIKSRLRATLYIQYPRIRKILETRMNIHINA